MKTAASPDFTTVVTERHSVRHYDPTVKLSREEIKELIALATKAPSSWNLQHWKFLVFHEDAVKARLLPIANNQQQVIQAAVVIAVLGDLEADKNAEPVYTDAMQAGNLSEEIKNIVVGQIKHAYANGANIARDEAIRNASLAAMQLMLAAKSKGYDTCAMGGFDGRKLITEFKIPARYLPIMLISVGKGTKQGRPTQRFPVDDVIVWNSW